MTVSLRETLPCGIGQQFRMTDLAVCCILKQPKMADLIQTTNLGLEESDHTPEIGLNDGRSFLLVGSDERRRLAGMQYIGDLLD
jgi:hypothetical protein